MPRRPGTCTIVSEGSVVVYVVQTQRGEQFLRRIGDSLGWTSNPMKAAHFEDLTEARGLAAQAHHRFNKVPVQIMRLEEQDGSNTV